MITTEADEKNRSPVEALIIANAERDKHLANAAHVVEVGAHHGYVITTDDRINDKKERLKDACGIRVVRPAEWLAIWDRQLS